MAAELDGFPSQIIGETFRGYRKENGLTQKELAKRARLTQAAISQIETGKRGSLESLQKLCTALNTDLSRLFADASKAAANQVSDSIRNAIKSGEDEGWMSPEELREDLGIQ